MSGGECLSSCLVEPPRGQLGSGGNSRVLDASPVLHLHAGGTLPASGPGDRMGGA